MAIRRFSKQCGTLLLLAGCGAPGAPHSQEPQRAPLPTAPSVASVAAPVPLSYLPLFTSLVATIDAHHQFAEGRRPFWEAQKPVLQKEFVAAATRDDAIIALQHLQNALGDRHCRLSSPNDLRPKRFSIGLDLVAVAGSGPSDVRAYVAAIEDRSLKTRISVGDEVVAIEGASIAAFLAQHPFASNALNPDASRNEALREATHQTAPWTRTKEGDTRTLRIVHSGVSGEHTLRFQRPQTFETPGETFDVDDEPPMAKISCDQEKTGAYKGYAVATVGANLCVYRPIARDSKRPVIVRFLSFMYDINHGDTDAVLRTIKVDHDLLATALKGDDRVIVDLHENHGGYNPFLFLSWFAKKPWGHERVSVHVSKAFSEDETRTFLWGNQRLVDRYQKAAAANQETLEYPFLCAREDAPGHDHACDHAPPRPAERVTEAPVAVITGQECTSSCDAFSALWGTFDEGPIVGKQPMHGFTTVRHTFPLVGPDNRDLGRFSIALSSEAFAGHAALEGQPIHLDWTAPEAPPVEEGHDAWVDDAVAEAERRLDKALGATRKAR